MSDALSSQPIQVPSDPTTSLQVATKGYVDANVGNRVIRNGDTMLGSLFLAVAGSPAATEAVDRQWVDARIASGAGGTLTAINVTSTPAGNIASSNVQAALNELDTKKVAKAGDTMTGFLTLNGLPTSPLHACTKSYADKFGTTVISQPSTLATWTIVHGLNRYPEVHVKNSANETVIGAVDWPNANTIEISFSAAFSGTVYLN